MTIGKLLKATQRGVRFAKDQAIKLGDEIPTERAIQNEIDTAKVAKGSLKPSVTQGKASVSNFIKDQMAASPGMQARSKQDNAFARMIRNAKTKKEKEALQEALNKIREKRRRADARAETKRRANISSGSRGKTKEVDNFAVALKAANETGELVPEFDKLTKNQQSRILNSAKRKLEEGDPTENNKKMLRKVLAKMTAGDTSMNRGGKVTKRARGAHDYRMNKGGLLLSSVDNRKKKK